MVDRINVERIVRKALETQLQLARPALLSQVPLEARNMPAYEDGFPIWWPNMTFYGHKDETKPPFYCRFSFHPAPPRTRTLGANPRTLMRGHCIIGCFVPEGEGEDAVDNLVNAVLAAYPVNGKFSREGFDTFIERVDPKPAFGSLGRYYRPVHVNWDCWRSEP